MDTTYRRPIEWTSQARTHVGVVRKVNEDSVFENIDAGLWGVADGMGGHHVGDLASQKVVAALAEVNAPEHLADYVDCVEDSILAVNQRMLDYAEIMFDNETMGSTLVSLIIKERIGVCLWIGDSRLYRFRNNSLVRLTKDHSQLEEMIELGMLSPADAENHPHRNVITRAVGVEPQIYIDINTFMTQVGDIYLLCSDGLYNAVCDQVLIDILSSRNIETSADQLIEAALANGASDNVSVILVQGNPGKVPSSQGND